MQFNLQCGVSTYPGESPSPLTNVFPNLTLFTKQPYQKSITNKAHPNGLLCDVWKYHYGTLVNDTKDDGSSTFEAPDAQGYAGDYYFYVSSVDGTPVQFRSDVGHNAVLGGSHTDLYIVDYLWVMTVSAFDDGDFQPPAGMPCQPSSSPFGPTYWHGDGRADLHPMVVRSNPFEDLASLFPGQNAAKIRSGRFQDYVTAHSKTYSNAEYAKRKFLFGHHTRCEFSGFGAFRRACADSSRAQTSTPPTAAAAPTTSPPTTWRTGPTRSACLWCGCRPCFSISALVLTPGARA